MAELYVYDQSCDDFTNFGLVGALRPEKCQFEEVANGLSELTIVHPIDDAGRYVALKNNNLIVAEVPVRTTPEIEGEAVVTSVEKWTVRSNATASKAQRTLYKKRTGNQKIKAVPGETSVTVVKKAENRYKVKCRYGTGWMDPDGLNYEVSQTIADNSQSIESVQPAWSIKPQIFRIYEVQKNINSITAMARHISYDLLYNATKFKKTGSTTCAEALKGIMNGCVADHEFEAYTNMVDVRTGVEWEYANPISALLDPETGLTALYGAALVRDNWEMYILHDPGMNRGVTVEYGKNMTSIKYSESYDDIATRIIPIGETKEGERLFLSGDEPWVDSPRIGDYPVVYTKTLECTDCKVGDGTTTAIARNRMREQAQAVFDAGGDLPTVEMTVSFVNLGDTEQYSEFKDLEKLFLWDYVTVRNKKTGIDVTSRVVSIKWDCLLDRMDSVEIGAVGKTLSNTGITTWQIPTGFSGNKIADGTVGSKALQEDIIAARHIQAESINTDALQAGSVTAEKIQAGAIDADAIKAITGAFNDLTVNDELYAAFANIVKLSANSIEAGQMSVDKLAANLAEVITLTAGTGKFDLATIKNMLSEALILEQGQAGSMQIVNLAVTSANLLNATVGELVLKGSDGLYYRVYVGTDGIVHTEETSVLESEITAGKTWTGNQIVETTANIKDLNAQNIKGQSALIETIVTTALNAGKITATDALIASATIPALYATAIEAIGDSLDLMANKTIQFIVGTVSKKSETYRQELPPTNAEYGDIWIQTTTGYTWQLSDENIPDNILPEISIDDDGNLIYTFGDGQAEFELLVGDDGNLEYNGTDYMLEIDDNGQLTVKGQWVRVVDNDAYEAIDGVRKSALSKEEFRRYMRFDVADGLHIGKTGSNSELVLDEQSVNVKIGNVAYSRFAANYVQFGQYQIRRSQKGALVFKLEE